MKKILITRTDRLGDVILSTPAFKAVRENFPDSHIAVMVTPYTRECVEGNPYINEVIIYDKRGSQKSLKGSLKFAMELRRKRFNLALILHPTNRVNLMTFLAGIPERVGFNRKMGVFLTKKLPHTKQAGEKHEVDYTLDVVKAAGMAPRSRKLYFPVKRKMEEKVGAMLSDMDLSDNDSIIAMHPSSSCPSKKWQPRKFARLADRLIEQHGAKIVFIGGPDVGADADEVIKNMKNTALDLSGKTTVAELASLLKKCALFISNDSGPVHVSSAVGTPVISIFGRKDPGLGPLRWGPVGTDDIAFHKETECTACLAHNCIREFLCLNAISEDEVLNEAQKILNRRPL